MSRCTLRRRLIAVLVGLVAAVALATGVLSTLALRGSLMDQLDERALASSQRAVGAQHEGPAGTPPPTPPDPASAPPGLEVPGQPTGTVNVSVGEDGTRSGYIDDDGALRPLTDDQEEALLAVTAEEGPTTVELDGLGSYRVVAVSAPDGTVVTGVSTDEVDATVRDYVGAEAGIALAGIVLAALAGGLLVRRQLRPLDDVAATATRVAGLPLHEGQVALGERVPAQYTDPATEVGQVGAALNQLLGHVERALQARHESETHVRQFVADASHELRTPLASIRGYAELLRRLPGGLPDEARQALARVESESQRMTALVEDLLLLARLDAGRPLERVEVDLALLAVDAVADAHVAAPDHTWELDLPDPETDHPVTVVGDEDRLRQVFANLLANARVHTPHGTTVTTTVRREGAVVVLRVLDDGPGIPDDLVPRLFRRFARGDAARSPGSGSSGLGLSIVDAVVRAHDGRIDVDGDAGATAFTVTLPAAG
ncbi:two-component system, OmpR family, sensor kinase [Georgenia satyanarayanai]|uniref:histidine kinase n=1 Tax=Georgenia satyanarayanai TaxID=860221 RepID=A0A2Y8ZYC2_9MICO|nr:HAMP domain-containing sensor histidine kinase [Georgenia satyanarayanai]PYG02182.1 two-component system OmpR family sensor kinase [Georgenia satyanarayanai]SSA37005.1 two-component system, OmpR family, sensor kinase [Georgenia satyanarayanai]